MKEMHDKKKWYGKEGRKEGRAADGKMNGRVGARF